MSKCLEWTGPKLKGGYGSLWHPRTKRKTLAHRFAWEEAHGAIPKGLFVLHHCDNPSCVRPSHLFLGTQTDNMRDCANKGRLGGTFQPGEAAPNVKLTLAQVNHIRELRGVYFQKEIAVMYGVTKKTIGRIHRRESWT